MAVIATKALISALSSVGDEYSWVAGWVVRKKRCETVLDVNVSSLILGNLRESVMPAIIMWLMGVPLIVIVLLYIAF